MTQEDQYQLIGKAHEDYRAAKIAFSALKVENQEISDLAGNLANAIVEPSRVIVPEEGQSYTLAGARNPFVLTDGLAKKLTADSLRKHVADYKAAKQKCEALRQRLVSLGQTDPGPC